MAKKENFHPYYIGTEHGRISFGQVRESNEIAACMLESGPDAGRHYIVMEETGSAAGVGLVTATAIVATAILF